MSNATPLAATRPKRRIYTITLRGEDANSYLPIDLTQPTNNYANYFVNLPSMMTLEEMDRPYFVRFTFICKCEDVTGSPQNNSPQQLFLTFNGQGYPHFTDYNTQRPNGYLRYYVGDNPNTYGLVADLKDNEEVYISSLRGVTQIGLKIMDCSNHLIPADLRFLCTISLIPADF